MRTQDFVRKPANAAVRAALAGNLSQPNGSTNIGFNGTCTGANPAPVTLTLDGNTCPVT
jgi:hypothetical protein